MTQVRLVTAVRLSRNQYSFEKPTTTLSAAAPATDLQILIKNPNPTAAPSTAARQRLPPKQPCRCHQFTIDCCYQYQLKFGSGVGKVIVENGDHSSSNPPCGVYNENPLCYLLSIDGFNFLMDCGWNDFFDLSLLQPLFRVASKIDAVLISHSDVLHVGALPYAMKKLGLSTSVYCTEPVYRLGLLTMYDH